jgi:hypothetical protein
VVVVSSVAAGADGVDGARADSAVGVVLLRSGIIFPVFTVRMFAWKLMAEVPGVGALTSIFPISVARVVGAVGEPVTTSLSAATVIPVGTFAVWCMATGTASAVWLSCRDGVVKTARGAVRFSSPNLKGRSAETETIFWSVTLAETGDDGRSGALSPGWLTGKDVGLCRSMFWEIAMA